MTGGGSDGDQGASATESLRSQLARSEALRIALMAGAPDATVVMDAAGRVLEWNPAAEKAFGRSREEVLGELLVELILTEDVRDRYRTELRAYFGSHEGSVVGKRVEVLARRADGTEIPVEIAIARHASGSELVFTAYIRDISARVESDAAVRSAESRLRRLTESGIMAIVVADEKGIITEANQAFLDMLGYSRDDLAHGAIRSRDLTPAEAGIVDDRSRQELRATGATRPWQMDLHRKDGSRVPVLMGITMLDERNVLCVILDLTAQKRAEAEARAMREKSAIDSRFRGLLESAADAMVIVDGEARIVFVNTQVENVFGYRPSELLGKSVEKLMSDRSRPFYDEHRDSYMARPSTRAMDSTLDLYAVRKDGSEVSVEISLTPIATDVGVWIAGAIRDVTERKRTEKELQILNRELESFSYSVAHDLRTPLRGMNGFAQVLIDDYADKLDAEGLDCLLRIRTHALQMGDLIDALLALSRVGRTDVKPAPTDLGMLARESAARLQASRPTRVVDFSAVGNLVAPIDPVLARLLLDNLIGNAWKFTSKEEHPRIEVGAIEGRLRPTFFVRDNGAGFDEAYASKLFLPFQRLHSSREFPGTGIGLATARRIVDRHEGAIWAEGRVGKGATFFFSIGLASDGGSE